jgi:hypothetical protein
MTPMPIHGHDSPEAAAMAGFPSAHCRVIASRVDGRNAYVLLNTGTRERPYLYGGTCVLRDGHWHDGNSGNGGGWSPTDDEGALGIWSVWGEAPANADMVRVEFNCETSEHPVLDGAYLVVWFNQPFGDGLSGLQPRVTAFRTDGAWMESRWPWM